MTEWLEKYREEIIEITKIVKSWIFLFLFLFLIFFLFSPKDIINPRNSLTSVIFQYLYNYYIRGKFQLIFLTPIKVLFLYIKLSFYLALIFSIPYLLYKVWKYISEALYESERKLFTKYFLPSLFLFLAGILFALLFFIPLTLNLFFWFAENPSYVIYFDPDEFLKMIFILSIACGIIFELPIIMYVLSKFGIIKPSVWKTHQKTFLFLSLVFSAIITPDGTGITMILLTVILYLLYLVGYFISRKGYKEE